VGREVFKTLKDDKVEKIEEKYAEIVGDIASSFLPKQVKDLVTVPADSIKEFAKEAKETEFTEGVMIYIKEREAGSTINQLYQNTPEELIYGGIGGELQLDKMLNILKHYCFQNMKNHIRDI
jgi:hypothetical protein